MMPAPGRGSCKLPKWHGSLSSQHHRVQSRDTCRGRSIYTTGIGKDCFSRDGGLPFAGSPAARQPFDQAVRRFTLHPTQGCRTKLQRPG